MVLDALEIVLLLRSLVVANKYENHGTSPSRSLSKRLHMTSRVVLLVVSLFQASVARCDVGVPSWDGSQWPEPIQQAFVEAIVWDSATWDPDEEAADRATKNSEEALERAFELAKAESPRIYASVLVAAADGSVGLSSYRTQLLDAVNDMLKSNQQAQTLEQIKPVLLGRGRAKAFEIVEAMRRGAEQAEAAATDAAIRSTQILMGSLSDQDTQWCIEAIIADPTFVPAWAALAIKGETEVQRYAATEWTRLEPENGAPDILLAELGWREQDAIEQAVGIEYLESAVSKPSLSWPQFKTPTEFDITYPDSAQFRDADVVGRTVPPAALSELGLTINLTGSVTRSLRSMYYIYLDDESKNEDGRVVDRALQDRAARAISILAARICDRAGYDLMDFMRASLDTALSLGFHRLTDDEKRTDLTPAERRLMQARRKAIVRIRADLDRFKDTEKLLQPRIDRDTLAAIRAESNFEDIVKAILAERASSPNSLQ